MKEKYLVLEPSGQFRWIEIDRLNMLKEFYKAIGCDCIELVTLPFDFCILVDEVGKLKQVPQPLNPLASRFYPGTLYGDPIVGPVIFVRIGLVDGEYDWGPLTECDLAIVSSITGKELP